jgi:competence protein ComEA
MRQGGTEKPPDSDATSGPPERTRWSTLVERWLPESWVRSRVDPGRAGLLGLLLLGLIAAGVVAVTVWAERPVAAPAPEPSRRPPVLDMVAPSPPPTLVVSVVGRVARPGLVEVRAGARVADALAAAGGPLPDTDVTALNLARKLVDGEQLAVAVPTPPAAEPASANGQAATATGDGKLDLNAADVEQLDQLPGIGRVTAERIVRWRTEHGRFASIDQLREVGGIGQTRWSRLRDLVRA